ncbi:hypothetical protein [Caldithrix abyssi]
MANSIYQFKAGAANITGTDLLRKVQGVAYSGLPLKHDSWDDVIFDLSTTKSAQKIPLLLNHNRDKRVGFTDSVTIASNVTFKGSLLQQSKFSKEVIEAADEGFPWQLSVHIEPEFTEKVTDKLINGQRFTGTVFRNNLIREISFTPTGVDANTSATVFSDAAFNPMLAAAEKLAIQHEILRKHR